jgi:hypothetical protein
MPLTIRPLDDSTCDAFAELVERNNGVFGGCWCIGFLPERNQGGINFGEVKEGWVQGEGVAISGELVAVSSSPHSTGAVRHACGSREGPRQRRRILPAILPPQDRRRGDGHRPLGHLGAMGVEGGARSGSVDGEGNPVER